jgi:hypothetical protein
MLKAISKPTASIVSTITFVKSDRSDLLSVFVSNCIFLGKGGWWRILFLLISVDCNTIILLMPNYLPLIITAVLALWNLILTFTYLTLRSHYNLFTKDTEKKDLLSVLNELLKSNLKNQKEIESTNKRIDQEIEKNKLNFKKIGFKRFNPFTSTGGDQSFCLCLLDENDNGFVISSLHSRENTRIYAKKIEKGASPDQVLSDEEKAVILAAQK